jgi:hypothetical protein
MRLAWCDKIALLAWIPVTLFAGMMTLGAPPTNPGFFTAWFDLSLMTVLPLWISLRLISLILFGLPSRAREIPSLRRGGGDRLP